MSTTPREQRDGSPCIARRSRSNKLPLLSDFSPQRQHSLHAEGPRPTGAQGRTSAMPGSEADHFAVDGNRRKEKDIIQRGQGRAEVGYSLHAARYRASHLVVDLVWLTCILIVPLSAQLCLGFVGIWQNWLGSRAKYWKPQIKVNQTQVCDQMGHPVISRSSHKRGFMKVVPICVK